MSEGTSHPTLYEPSGLTVLGSLHSLTLQQDEPLGHNDGFTFLGQAITNISP